MVHDVAGFARIQMFEVVEVRILANPGTVRGALLTRRVGTVACGASMGRV